MLAWTTSCLQKDQEEVGRDRDGGHRRGHGRGLACRGPFFWPVFSRGVCFYYLGRNPRSQHRVDDNMGSPLSDRGSLTRLVGLSRKGKKKKKETTTLSTQVTLARHHTACHSSSAGPFNLIHYPVLGRTPSEAGAWVGGWVDKCVLSACPSSLLCV